MKQAFSYMPQALIVVIVSTIIMPATSLACDDNSSLMSPSETGVAMLDEEIKIVCSYVNSIEEIKQTQYVSAHIKEFLGAEIIRAIELFQPCIESGPSFLAVKKYWKKFTKDVKKHVKSSKIDIPLMHVIGLKLIVFSDLSHFSATKMATKFVYAKHGIITSLFELFICRNFGDYTVEDVLNKNLNAIYKEVKSSEKLSATIPLFSRCGVYGLNAFLYAFFKNILIQSYPVVGNDQAHNGKWGSFYQHMQFFPTDPDAIKSRFKEEKFISSVLFAEHDRRHNEAIRYYLKECRQKFLAFYQLFSFDETNKVQSTLHAIMLFFITQEVSHVSSLEGIKNMINLSFKDYESYKEGTTSYRKLMALKDIDDYAKLLVEAGSNIQLNENEPWKNGPMVRSAFLQIINDMYSRVKGQNASSRKERDF